MESDQIHYAGFAFTFILFAAPVFIVLYQRQAVWRKVGVVLLGLVFAVTIFVTYAELLSRPKPISFERAIVPEVIVLGAVMKEKKAIYLWLAIPGVKEPRSYVLPWDLQKAKELQKAMQQAKGNGTRVRMRKPFEKSLEERQAPMFYAEPQQALPPKPSSAQPGISGGQL